MMDSFLVMPNKINWSDLKNHAQRWWLSNFIKSPLNTPWALPRLHLPWQHMAARNDTPTKHTKNANAHETIMTSYYNFAKLQNPHLSKHLTCQLLLFNCPCLSHALPLSLYQTIKNMHWTIKATQRAEDGQHHAQMCYLDLTPHSAEVTTRIVMFVGLGIQI